MLPSKEYVEVWKQFARGLRSVYEMAGQCPGKSSGINLHSQISEMHWVPYDEIRAALEIPVIEGTSENIGAITGLFFEQAATALLVPVLRKRIPNVRIERNYCTEETVRSVARDPDLYATVSGKHLVIEFKVSPKKVNLENVLWARGQYAKLGVGYYFLGGYASASRELLHKFISKDKWACILDVSSRNQDLLQKLPKFDETVENMMDFLNDA